MRNKNRIWIYFIITIGFGFFLINGCKKEDEKLPPVLTTSTINDITLSTATGGGDISNDGGAKVIARGVCWSTAINPSIDLSTKTTDGLGIGSFSSSISGLEVNTTYYVRAYATNSVGTSYGDEVTFSTFAVADIDGNYYKSVTIGTQTWLVENLKTSKYRNGDLIPNITDNRAWMLLETEACCDYNNDPNNSKTYGKLYNWFSVHDRRNIAPVGWHVSTDAEWTTLATFLGGKSIAGGKLKEAGFSHWNSPNTGATNVVNFKALPSGMRGPDGTFSRMGHNSSWWCSDFYDGGYNAWFRDISYSLIDLYRSYSDTRIGFSVRCVKD